MAMTFLVYLMFTSLAAAARKKCPSGEHWVNCTSRVGPLKCDDVLDDTKPITKGHCTSGCVCNKGYLRDSLDDCVPQASCPCYGDAHWVACKSAVQGPQTCDELGNIFDYTQPINYQACQGGCICNEGYLRNSDKNCVPVEECPSCGGDFNATAGTGKHCGNLCSNYEEEYVICTNKDRKPNLCNCKNDFVFDQIISKCVAPIDCQKPCKGDFYAVQKKCAANIRATCDDLQPEQDSKCVLDGCECIDGYVLNRPEGRCIPIEECPDY